MMKVKFEFDKMVSYWHKDKGAGVKIDGTTDMSSWNVGIDWDFVTTINDVNEVKRELELELEKYGMPTDYFVIMDDGRISFNVLEDGDSNALDDDLADKLHEEGKQVYLCDYNVFIEIQEVYEPSMEQLKQMFPDADY